MSSQMGTSTNGDLPKKIPQKTTTQNKSICTVEKTKPLNFKGVLQYGQII